MNWKNLEESSICNHFKMLGENTKKKKCLFIINSQAEWPVALLLKQRGLFKVY